MRSKRHKQVIVIEENVPQGGLAPQTKQIAWDIQAKCRLDTFTLQGCLHPQLWLLRGSARGARLERAANPRGAGLA